MFTEVQIENYKSIQNLKINLGRVNVFIGENGCGKSNILEAIALAGAAAGNKLDNEFLAPRGIRVTEPEFMRSAFDKENVTNTIKINIKGDDEIPFTNDNDEVILNFELRNDNKPYSAWSNISMNSLFKALGDNETKRVNALAQQAKIFFQEQINQGNLNHLENDLDPKSIEETSFAFAYNFLKQMSISIKKSSLDLKDFIIYSPENSFLRTFKEEGQVQPLGTKGEGLLKLLKVLNNSPDKINEIKKRLELIDWFGDFNIDHNNSDLEKNIQIKDRYLDKELPYFNQRSSNEGFLFLMFYFALFVSDDTPKFFAIDNIENALNPKLCTRLIQELVELAKKYDKQVIFTTHNPAILDGLDLNDDEQRLFVIYRNMDGHTQAKQIAPLEPLDDGEIVPLSEAFINGYIGGLPKNF
ncbi:MAG: chromosome segregation protein SMC [Pseudanabaena sp.]|nr:MAG: chromosome segregation protein SMC [Pseudanabaena sp.]